jgi:hypothetical protein
VRIGDFLLRVGVRIRCFVISVSSNMISDLRFSSIKLLHSVQSYSIIFSFADKMGVKRVQQTKKSATNDKGGNPFQDGQQHAIQATTKIMPYGAHYEEDMSRLYIHASAPATDESIEDTTGSEILNDKFEGQVPVPEDHLTSARQLWICVFIICFIVYCVDLLAVFILISITVLVFGILAKFGLHWDLMSSPEATSFLSRIES